MTLSNTALLARGTTLLEREDRHMIMGLKVTPEFIEEVRELAHLWAERGFKSCINWGGNDEESFDFYCAARVLGASPNQADNIDLQLTALERG